MYEEQFVGKHSCIFSFDLKYMNLKAYIPLKFKDIICNTVHSKLCRPLFIYFHVVVLSPQKESGLVNRTNLM